MTARDSRVQQGLSLIDLVIALVILTLIALVAVPSIGVLEDDRDVERILGTVARLEQATQKHRRDTGRFAVEDSRVAEPVRHQLSARQGTKGWAGPYLDRPLGPADNPAGGLVILHASFQGDLAVPYERGFRINGPNSPPRRGPGQFVSFHDVPEHLARLVDDALDRGVAGSWQRYGRVQWNGAEGGSLMIHLLD
ncbi:MAG: hypothetical protein H6807_00325 [Planctomycetes bacterium]|nr:hypothetical protein [Planctomycetota bacterium]